MAKKQVQPPCLGGPFMNRGWTSSPKNVRTMSFKAIMKRMKIHLCAKICTRCDCLSKVFDFGPNHRNQHVMLCGTRVIGYYNPGDGTITITGRGVPSNCPYMVEYLMMVEKKKEDRSEKPLWQRVQDVIRERKSSKK